VQTKGYNCSMEDEQNAGRDEASLTRKVRPRHAFWTAFAINRTTTRSNTVICQSLVCLPIAVP
jgi:hypothetical protein